MTNPPNLIISSCDLQQLEALLDALPVEACKDQRDLIEELERADIRPLAEMPPDAVRMRSTVRFSMDMPPDQLCLTLVYPHEADFDKGRVSVLAPVGSALLGLSVGQTIDWTAPGGRQLRLRVTAVHYQPEAAGDFHR